MTEEHLEGDMGPFAGIDAALKGALERYGEEVRRRIVRVSVRCVASYSFDDLPRDINSWITWLTNARSEVPMEYKETAQCVLTYDRGYYDEGGSASLDIWYERPETDAEMVARITPSIETVMDAARKRERDELAAYKRLKAKFEG